MRIAFGDIFQFEALSDLQVTLTNNPPSVSNPPPQFPVPRGVNESALPGPFPSSANGSGEVIVGVTINLVAALNSTPARYVVVRQQTKNDSLRLCEVKVNPNRIRGPSIPLNDVARGLCI